ncbi:MAG: hypothetical protein KDC98_19115 [Planctomycetes bacterium]|nr:hypothetical protein [Planctomycetota bacterium]
MTSTLEMPRPGPAAPLSVKSTEPLAFELQWQEGRTRAAHVETLLRARLPHVARYGNPTPAGGRQRYLLRAGSVPKRARPTVAVTAATFHRGGAVERPALGIGRIEQVQATSLVGTFPVSQVPLHNPLDRDVEVLLRVRLQQPRDCTALYGVRLPARGDVDFRITTRPSVNELFLDADIPPGCAMKASAVELVDWCLVGAGDPAAGALLLRPAYAAWYRWPDESASVRGAFSYRARRQKPVGPQGAVEGYDDFAAIGRFSLGRDGKVRLELSSGQDDGIDDLLREAFADVLRPDFDGLAAANKFAPVAADRVAVIGPGWNPMQPRAAVVTTAGSRDRPELASYLLVEDGRVVGDDFDRWQHRRIGGREVVVRRVGSSVERTWSWIEADGRLVPNVVTSTTTFGDRMFRTAELCLHDLEVGDGPGVAPAPAAVTGDGSAALRAIWDGGFRLTSAPLVIEAGFEVQTPGTDLVWHGVAKSSGRVVLRGIGPHLQRADFTFVGKLDAAQEIAVAAAIRDRFLIWYPRDFNARAPFDTHFAGCEVAAADAAGDFDVRGHSRLARVLTGKGVVEGLQWSDGSLTRFRREQVGGQAVVTRITEEIGGPDAARRNRWTAETSVRWRQFGDHVLPVAFVFERIFGTDWGPEKIVLRDVVVCE